MAAPWLYNVSLLVLLVTSCPGSQSITTIHLCGYHLEEALYLLCGERGFLDLPNPALRLYRRAASVGGEDNLSEFALQDQMEMMAKRTVDPCCYKPCGVPDLEKFCRAASSDTST